MSPEEAMERINTVLAHAWMVRNFLKHADEVQDDEEMLEVHRTIFDFIRAAEPSYQRKDAEGIPAPRQGQAVQAPPGGRFLRPGISSGLRPHQFRDGGAIVGRVRAPNRGNPGGGIAKRRYERRGPAAIG